MKRIKVPRVDIKNTSEYHHRRWPKAKRDKLRDDVDTFVKGGGEIKQYDHCGEQIK